MRVLFDYSAFVMQSRGGVSRVLFEAFQHMLQLDGVECCLFAGFHKNKYLRDASSEVKQHIIGWYLPPLIVMQRFFMPMNRFLFQFFAKKYQPDICHYTYFDTPTVPDGCKVVVTVHDMIHELYPEMFASNDPQRGWKSTAVKRADGIVCVSNNTLHDLGKYVDLEKKQTCVIYHGNSFSQVKPTSLAVTKPYFLYVGSRSVPYKNFDLVLEALADPDIVTKVSLVCFGGGDLESQELKLIDKFGLLGRVSQVSGSDELLAAYYKNARALIYPSTYEGFGLPPLEAMGLGCPVIVSSAPPIPEVVENAGFYFNPKCSDELVRCMQNVLLETEREQWSVMGMAQSRKFQWSKIVRQLLSFYKQLLKAEGAMR